MKKIALVLFVAVLGIALTVPAYALENKFGGYWRVRMFNQTDFDGKDNDVSRSQDVQRADTRTRLYYTAIINDNLKLVNKFEMNAVWGSGDIVAGDANGNFGLSYGDVGADGLSVKVKNTYADFNLGAANIKLGTQGEVIHRGLFFDDDFSGITARISGLRLMYQKVEENGDGAGDDVQNYHVDYAFGGDAMKITPSITYTDVDGGNSIWYIGADLDGSAGALGYFATLIYQGGQENDDVDYSAYLVDLGASIALSDAFSLKAEVMYASGDDDAADDENNAFSVYAGQSYYWAEIMGYGIFDNQASNNACADAISDIMAANLGFSFGVNEKLTIGADLWYAQLVEDDANGNTDLGTEIDLSASYVIIEGLNLDVVAAYLFAGDSTTDASEDDANPFEIGARFSIAF